MCFWIARLSSSSSFLLPSSFLSPFLSFFLLSSLLSSFLVVPLISSFPPLSTLLFNTHNPLSPSFPSSQREREKKRKRERRRKDEGEREREGNDRGRDEGRVEGETGQLRVCVAIREYFLRKDHFLHFLSFFLTLFIFLIRVCRTLVCESVLHF